MTGRRHPPRRLPLSSSEGGWRPRSKAWARTVLMLSACLVQACAAGPSGQRAGMWTADRMPDGPVRSLREMRRDGVVMQAWDLSCGAAALATLLNYHHGDPVSELEITRGLIDRDIYLETPELVKARQGFSLADLARFTNARGYRAGGFGSLAFADLAGMTPLILPIFENGQSHFVVYRGVWQGQVLLSDPAFGVRTMRRTTFERLWIPVNDEVGRVGFTVDRRDGLDPPDRLRARPADFMMSG